MEFKIDLSYYPETFIRMMVLNNRLLIEFVVSFLKENYSDNILYYKKLLIFKFNNTRFLIRSTKNSSSTKDIGRKNIKVLNFESFFDFYLKPRIVNKQIIFEKF